MQLEGAVVQEQGVTFAIVVVKAGVIRCAQRATQAAHSFQRFFPGLPIVLMAQDSGGRATYRGRKDISRFLARIPIHSIPWKRYTFD